VEDDADDADFAVEGDDDEQAEDEGDLDEDEILGRKRTSSRTDTSGAAGGESTAEGEAAVTAGGRGRAEDVDDLVLHGASKRRRVLADEEESD
jgi:hypothetical protein